MSMRDKFPVFLAVVLTAVIVNGCGGGGGSGESVNYEGETMPAVIDTSSALDLALGATLDPHNDYESGMDLLALGEGGSTGSGILEVVANPAKAFDFASRFIENAGPATSLAVAAEPLARICSDPEREYGIEGYVEGYVCFDTDNTNWIKIVLKYVDYDDGEYYIDGQLVIAGTESDFKVTFRDLVTQGATEDSYIDGWVDYEDDTAGQVVTITYNLALVDSYNEEAYWLDDYVIVADYGNDEVTLSGRFYDYEDGYVILTTETVLDWDLTMGLDGILEWADHPTGGSVKLTGADGYWISITFSETGFSVQVNFMDDDAADVTIPEIGEIPWV